MACKNIALKKFALIVIVVASFVVTSQAFALPYNDDMVHDQFKTSEVMRDAPRGSIPVGAHHHVVDEALSPKNFTPEGIAARANLKNPVERTESSVANGKRLWNVNCTPCHGSYSGKEDPALAGSAKFLKSIDPVAAGATAGPSLVSKGYMSDPNKSDGHLFSYIHFGGLAVMPRYGYKLSPREHWDIVNYVRWMQEDFSKVLGESQ